MPEAESKEKHDVMYNGTLYAGVDHNLTLCSFQSRLQHIYHGQPHTRVDLNPMSESSLSPRNFRFGHWTTAIVLSVVLHDHNYTLSSLRVQQRALFCSWCNVDQIHGWTLRSKIMWHYPFRALIAGGRKYLRRYLRYFLCFRRRSLVRSCQFSLLDRWKKRSCA